MKGRRPSVNRSIYAIHSHGDAYTQSLYEAAKKHGIKVKKATLSIRWLMSNLRCGDTLHMHWPSFSYYNPHSRIRSTISLLRFIVICSILRLRGICIIWTAHNLYPHDGGKNLWIHRIARRFVVHIADRIFVHGPTSASIVREEFKLDIGSLRIIDHGHWIGKFPNRISSHEARLSLGLSPTDHIFLFTGLCKAYKGLEELIDAAAKLPLGVSLVIAGRFPSPDYQAEIIARAENSGTSCIRIFPGYIPDEKLQVFLNAANTVVLPYNKILTSGAAMLAMSFGRPVVAPRLGSLADFVDERCGILYDSKDPTSLEKAMRRACNTDFNSDEIMNHVASFSWDKAAQALIEEHIKNDLTYRHSYLKTTITTASGLFFLLALNFIYFPLSTNTSYSQVVTASLWLGLFILGVVFISGIVVLNRESRERKHQPDLFYKHFSRTPTHRKKGWRHIIRPLLGRTLRPGDLVCVKDAKEIFSTLDETGKLDGLPFMPEMLAYLNQEFLVDRRIDKINDWIGNNKKRRVKRIVTLVDSRCSGTAHGHCQTACQLLWDERWLRHSTGGHRKHDHTEDADQTSQPVDMQAEYRTLEKLLISSRLFQSPGHKEQCQRYTCQITELLNISTPLSKYDIRQDIRPLLNGNLSLTGWLIGVLTTIFNGVQKIRKGIEYPVMPPQLNHGPTPVKNLNLQPGDDVWVRDKHEIGLTLYKNHNRGMWFGKETLRFCNQKYTVHSVVERIINERTGEIIKLNPPCVTLRSVCASGEFHRFYPQNEFIFWRDVWLKKADPQNE